ncbi:hypothetical protein C4K29_3854 [Pseudomonas chlororaphis subsp. piscium]|uniref:DUF418 domain-containing protein n=1 Tax=Pseudomonas chlororaphis TaxID=587753 RepID=UPI000F6CB071|nr:DUF418 domain-containing protein [Pseudomonas chlororaphis]AZC90153.1 hypothetical protein C4K29_3854 [Pseudomonas chlororaphis subsp. piscium]
MSGGDQRITVLDQLRGVALCGMLFINAAYFAYGAQEAVVVSGKVAGLEAWSYRAWQILFAGKFVAIFSFLFGAGLQLCVVRAQARQAPWVGSHLRRAAVLYVLGLLHSLVWPSDILRAYAGFAVLLLPMLVLSSRWQRRVLILTFLAALCAPMLSAGSVLSFPAGLCFRLLPFVLGIYVAGAGGMKGAGERMPVFTWHLYIVVGAIVLLVAGYAGLLVEQAATAQLERYLRLTSYPLALCYGVCVVKIAAAIPDSSVGRGLAALGRMSLSNYLSQDSVGVLVIACLGLAPLAYSQVPIVVVLTLLLQWAFSRAWLRRFRSGPIETLAGGFIHGRRR